VHAVALMLAASLLAANALADRASPQRDYWIKAFIEWGAPLIKSEGVAGKAAEGVLVLGYIANVYGAHADVSILIARGRFGPRTAQEV
jgi:hypothetical protein